MNHLDYHNPHALLGLHGLPDGRKVIRIFRPGAHEVHFTLKGKVVSASKGYEAGLFEYIVEEKITPVDYKVYHHNGLLAHDPYVFWPTIGDVDLYLFGAGVHYQVYNILGAHRMFS